MATSLRSIILHHSLPLLPSRSFTRQTLAIALSCLPPSHPDHRSTPLSDSIIDTIFGNGPTAPGHALVDAWQEVGVGGMEGASVRERLKSRLGYSAGVGEHLVEAYSLMVSPSNTPSIPLPTIPPSILNSFSGKWLPPLYSPPRSTSPTSPFPSPTTTPSSTIPSSTQPTPSQSTLSTLSSLLESTKNRLPFLSFNPFGPLSYAWRIADAAILPDERASGVVKGLMNEPTGSSPEWYTSRIALALAYLSAESHLLQPIMSSDTAAMNNPHLIAAETTLDRHLDRYAEATDTMKSGEQGAGQLMGFMDYLGRTAAGLVRSRDS